MRAIQGRSVNDNDINHTVAIDGVVEVGTSVVLADVVAHYLVAVQRVVLPLGGAAALGAAQHAAVELLGGVEVVHRKCQMEWSTGSRHLQHCIAGAAAGAANEVDMPHAARQAQACSALSEGSKEHRRTYVSGLWNECGLLVLSLPG